MKAKFIALVAKDHSKKSKTTIIIERLLLCNVAIQVLLVCVIFTIAYFSKNNNTCYTGEIGHWMKTLIIFNILSLLSLVLNISFFFRFVSKFLEIFAFLTADVWLAFKTIHEINDSKCSLVSNMLYSFVCLASFSLIAYLAFLSKLLFYGEALPGKGSPGLNLNYGTFSGAKNEVNANERHQEESYSNETSEKATLV